jgi:proteasome lid subunit RPN8/RPN11
MNQSTVKVFGYRSDAEIARARLEADGIRSWVLAEDEGGLNPGFFSTYGVRLVVGEADLLDAFDSLGIERVRFPRPLAEAILRHARATAPVEACGLLLFDDDRPVFACCLTNEAASAHRFTISPSDHHRVLRFAESRDWTIGGVFHSHPRSEAYPSGADVEGGVDSRWLNVIVGPLVGGSTQLRAFRIGSGDIAEVIVAVDT